MELGSTVTLTYVGTTDDGQEFGHADKDHPMKFQTGMDMAIDGFEEEILKMNEVGEKRKFVVDQYKAYGEYLDDHVERIPMEQVPRGKVSVGQRVWMSSSEDGVPMPVTCTAIEDGVAVFDMNHPLAGKDLTFEVEILEIEELRLSCREGAPHERAAEALRWRPSERLSVIEKGRNRGPFHDV